MNNLVRNKRVIYWSKRDRSVDYEKYLTPVPVRLNYRKVSDEAIIEATGSIGSSYLIVKGTNAQISPYTEGDRFYLTMPSSFDITANDADYTVVSKTLGLDFGEMTLRAMVGDVYGN